MSCKVCKQDLESSYPMQWNGLGPLQSQAQLFYWKISSAFRHPCCTLFLLCSRVTPALLPGLKLPCSDLTSDLMALITVIAASHAGGYPSDLVRASRRSSRPAHGAGSLWSGKFSTLPPGSGLQWGQESEGNRGEWEWAKNVEGSKRKSRSRQGTCAGRRDGGAQVRGKICFPIGFSKLCNLRIGLTWYDFVFLPD